MFFKKRKAKQANTILEKLYSFNGLYLRELKRFVENEIGMTFRFKSTLKSLERSKYIRQEENFYTLTDTGRNIVKTRRNL